MKLRVGDKIMVIAGKDRGKQGEIEKVLRQSGKVIVAGLNLSKRHVKPNKKYPAGGIIEIAYPIDQSNIMLRNPDTDLPSRIGTKRTNKEVVRVFKNRVAQK